jgi:hypothetical protein
MEREEYRYQRELTGIHINLQDQAIEFEDRHGTIGRLVFGQETVLYEGQPLLLAPTDHSRGGATSIDESARHNQPPRPARAPRRPLPTPPPLSPREQ